MDAFQKDEEHSETHATGNSLAPLARRLRTHSNVESSVFAPVRSLPERPRKIALRCAEPPLQLTLTRAPGTESESGSDTEPENASCDTPATGSVTDPDTSVNDSDSDSSEDPVTSPVTQSKSSLTTKASFHATLRKRPRFTTTKPKPAARSANVPRSAQSSHRPVTFPAVPRTVPTTSSKRPLWEIDAEIDNIETKEKAFLAKSRARKMQLEREEEEFLARTRTRKAQLEGDWKRALGPRKSSRQELKSGFARLR
ncbi:MAG: hypothetical protein Q9208_002785 [Pyrenodesmia sp. 3 TL-2023]